MHLDYINIKKMLTIHKYLVFIDSYNILFINSLNKIIFSSNIF